MSTSLMVATAVLIDGAAALAGGLLSDRWLKRHLPAAIGFAAGALLAAVFLDVLPEAIAESPRALQWTLAGCVSLALLEWALGHGHTHDAPALPRVVPMSLLASDALHNIGDGAAIAAAFLASPRAGVAVSIAVVLHELPQEIGDYAILRGFGMPRARALLALTAVQLSAALGAMGVLYGAHRFHSLNGAVLSFAAGTFLYIAGTDLLPDVQAGHGAERIERIVGFLAGVVLIVAAQWAA